MAVTPDGGDELAARRREHEQELREASTHVVVVLPHTEGDVAKALGDLEEVLLAANGDEPLEGAGGPGALAAVGRLASYVAAVERGEAAVQPVAPDGRYELVPLHTVLVGREDLAAIADAAGAVVAAGQGSGEGALVEAVREWRRATSHGTDVVRTTAALSGLLAVGWDDDVAVVHGFVGGVVGLRPYRLVLDEAQMAAYDRVARRIQATWHAGDPLAGFLYRG